jgi:uncharacterized protein YbaP (TraB family)
MLSIIAAAACVFCPPQARAEEDNGPPLFMVERGDSRVYIFGGAAPKDRSWLTPAVSNAIEQSGELWQEDPVEPCSFNRDLNIELGARPSGKLFDDLDPAEEARVAAIAERLNFSLDQFQMMLPWAVGAVVAALDYPRHMAEYQPDDAKGAVQKMFLDRGLPVHSELEGCDDNVRFYAGFPESAAIQYAMYQIDLAELPSDQIPLWSEQWLDGDLSGWEAFNRRLATSYPDLYQVLEVERNMAWAGRIQVMLAQSGTHFIHVGIQHTVGPDSIQEKAKVLGLAVRQL